MKLARGLLVLGAFLAASTPGWLRADARVPASELRLGGMYFPAIRVDGSRSLFDHRLMGELGAMWLPGRGTFLEPALSVRLVGAPDGALWVRAGYLWQHVDHRCHALPDDDAHALDLSIGYRGRQGGFMGGFEAGREWLHRKGGFVCGDSVVDGDSAGYRLLLLFQWDFWRRLGVFVRGGARTADHMPEIHFLPELFIGLSHGW